MCCVAVCCAFFTQGVRAWRWAIGAFPTHEDAVARRFLEAAECRHMCAYLGWGSEEWSLMDRDKAEKRWQELRNNMKPVSAAIADRSPQM
eukprot:g2689.t1